jgi:hypothetical protein
VVGGPVLGPVRSIADAAYDADGDAAEVSGLGDARGLHLDGQRIVVVVKDPSRLPRDP